jgi:hypothetical protein
MAKFQPSVGQWYKNMETGETFEVVALADDGMSIEIQYFEGEVAEFESDTWAELVLSLLPPPEDWSGPFDDLEPEEIELDGSANGQRRQNPLDQIE